MVWWWWVYVQVLGRPDLMVEHAVVACWFVDGRVHIRGFVRMCMRGQRLAIKHLVPA